MSHRILIIILDSPRTQPRARHAQDSAAGRRDTVTDSVSCVWTVQVYRYRYTVRSVHHAMAHGVNSTVRLIVLHVLRSSHSARLELLEGVHSFRSIPSHSRPHLGHCSGSILSAQPRSARLCSSAVLILRAPAHVALPHPGAGDAPPSAKSAEAVPGAGVVLAPNPFSSGGLSTSMAACGMAACSVAACGVAACGMAACGVARSSKTTSSQRGVWGKRSTA